MGSEKADTWETYFGKTLIPHERADNQLSHETYNLPKSYEGKNKHLEDVLDFMIRSEDEFYTSKLLPWSFTDDLHVQWEIFRFNRTLMDVEPEQGIPRLVTAETERRSDNLLRRGLAFIIEHGFMTTERGRRHFMMNLQQITDAVHTTAYFGVMHALLSSKQHYKAWLRETDRHAKRPRNLLRTERNNWACVQKTHKGLYVLDAELKHQMKKNNVVPNVWVFPPKMSIYLDMAPREQTEYRLKGPKAAGNLEDDRSQQGIRWRDTEVFEAATFDIDFVNDDHDLLQRERQCGEFFVIPAGCDAIKIFSADHDEFKTIRRDTAWKYALNFGDDVTDIVEKDKDEKNTRKLSSFGTGEDAKRGFKKHIGCHIDKLADIGTTVRQLDKNPSSGDNLTAATDKAIDAYGRDIEDLWCCTEADIVKKVKAVAQRIAKEIQDGQTANKKDKPALKKFNDETKDNVAALYTVLFKKWVSDEQLVEKAQNEEDKKSERDILIFRPFQTYRMSSAILAAGGSDLGSTFHGHHDFQLSDDIIRKVHVGHYTHYSKSVVKNPKRYAIAEDVFAQGYVSGEGIEFFSEETLKAACQDGTIGTSECKQSLISWVIDSGSPASEATVLDMRGKFSDHYSEYGSSDFEGSIRLDDILHNCDISDEQPSDDIFLSNQYCDNTLCFRGKQFDEKLDTANNRAFRCSHLGHGHWKGLTYSGCMAVREGTIMTSDHKQHKIGEAF